MSAVSYRESHIAWLGEIPQHWELMSLGAIFKSRNELNRDKKLTLILSLIKDRGVIPYSEKGNVGNKAKVDLSQYKIARKNDLVINEMNAVIGSLGVSNADGLVSPIYLVLYVYDKSRHLMSYFSFVFGVKALQESLRQYASGIMKIRESIDFLDFKKMKLPAPPLQEQKAIAEFLDRKCGQIQRFITQKENLIKLLEELRESTINETITQGLDKSVERKPSGVEWLGEIPQHWEIRRFAMLGNFSKGSGLSRKDIRQDGVPCVLYGDIYTKYDFRILQAISKTTKEVGENCPMAINGDILIAGSGETKEDIGKAVVYGGNESLCIGGDIILFRPRGINSMFLSYVLNSSYAKSKKFLMAKGEIIVHIYASSLRDLQIPLPPLQEQEAIAEYLEGRLAKIDTAIEKTKNQVELMREYKTSLISQAVSGKINIKE